MNSNSRNRLGNKQASKQRLSRRLRWSTCEQGQERFDRSDITVFSLFRQWKERCQRTWGAQKERICSKNFFLRKSETMLHCGSISAVTEVRLVVSSSRTATLLRLLLHFWTKDSPLRPSYERLMLHFELQTKDLADLVNCSMPVHGEDAISWRRRRAQFWPEIICGIYWNDVTTTTKPTEYLILKYFLLN